MADNFLEKQREAYEARKIALEKKKLARRKELNEAYRKKLAEQNKNQ